MEVAVNLAEYLRRQFAYDAWANREVVAAMRSAGATGRSKQLMSHIFAAERVWIERLTQQEQSVPVWPEWDMNRLDLEATDMSRRWEEYLDQRADSNLDQSIHYKNTKGQQWSSTVIDVLTHVLTHSAYHRGQIASHMREKGQTPAYTDFIHGIRQGLVK